MKSRKSRRARMLRAAGKAPNWLVDIAASKAKRPKAKRFWTTDPGRRLTGDELAAAAAQYTPPAQDVAA